MKFHCSVTAHVTYFTKCNCISLVLCAFLYLSCINITHDVRRAIARLSSANIDLPIDSIGNRKISGKRQLSAGMIGSTYSAACLHTPCKGEIFITHCLANEKKTCARGAATNGVQCCTVRYSTVKTSGGGALSIVQLVKRKRQMACWKTCVLILLCLDGAMCQNGERPPVRLLWMHTRDGSAHSRGAAVAQQLAVEHVNERMRHVLPRYRLEVVDLWTEVGILMCL